MSYREFAVTRTSEEFDDRAFDFNMSPSAENWMGLDKAMKARQKAGLLPERDLELLLENAHHDDPLIEKEIVVEVLSMKYDHDMELLQEACRNNRIRLVRVDQLKAA